MMPSVNNVDVTRLNLNGDSDAYVIFTIAISTDC